MCLDTITKREFDEPEKAREGWKVFIEGEGRKLDFEFYPGQLKQGVWLQERSQELVLRFGFGPLYRKGFHVFKTLKDAAS